MVSDDEHAAAAATALHALRRALSLEVVGLDHYRSHPEVSGQTRRSFGGQLMGLALVASAATVEGKLPHSFHTLFVNTGTTGAAIDATVERTRDGKVMATRQVTLRQGDRVLLVALVSFHRDAHAAQDTTDAPVVAPPDQMPSIQDWARGVPTARHWLELPPPIELRLPDAPTFMGGSAKSPTRSHWMRAPGPLGEDAALHAAALLYASDFLLMDMAFRCFPLAVGPGTASGFSVDHAIWFHRPCRFDRWHLNTQQTVTIAGERGLVRGSIHDAEGQLVATVMQEVVVRPLLQR